jgi:hypothetical protein
MVSVLDKTISFVFWACLFKAGIHERLQIEHDQIEIEQEN